MKRLKMKEMNANAGEKRDLRAGVREIIETPPFQSTVDYGIRYLHSPYSGHGRVRGVRVYHLLTDHL